MAAWFLGLPVLFWHRWPQVTRWYGVYAVLFVAVSQISQWLLGECFLTAIALYFWEHVPTSAPVSHEWFTVRLAQFVFHATPSHRSITVASEAMIVLAAAATLSSLHHPNGLCRAPFAHFRARWR